MLIGYARVSTERQDLAAQLKGLADLGVVPAAGNASQGYDTDFWYPVGLEHPIGDSQDPDRP